MQQNTLCPKFEKAIGLLSQRWTGLVVYQLLEGPQRFCEIEAGISISGRLLSERLKKLEAEQMITRNVYPEKPVRIEYALTEKGEALKPVLDELQNWSDAWIPATETKKEMA